MIVALTLDVERAIGLLESEIPCGIGTVSFPFGPSTCNSSPTAILTPFGSGIGFFPTLDILN